MQVPLCGNPGIRVDLRVINDLNTLNDFIREMADVIQGTCDVKVQLTWIRGASLGLLPSPPLFLWAALTSTLRRHGGR